MLRQEFDKPVINIHEFTNGIIKYYNQTLNQEVLGKPNAKDWGYYQSLKEITELLDGVDHYITGRLAQYHIVGRQDPIGEQIKFYEYLNNNYYIISCRRENLFEHALSWSINAHSKKLNVYSPKEKIDTFQSIYENGITASKESIESYLTKYKNYIEWSDSNFNIQSYFNYDTDVHRIEDYILNLDFMKNNKNNSWQAMFGHNFDDYNACHRLLPNLILNPESHQGEENVTLQLNWQGPNLQLEYKKENTMTSTEKNKSIIVSNKVASFLKENLSNYISTSDQIVKLVDAGFLITNIPVKLQSFKEKQKLIKNYDETIEWYNNWVTKNNFGKHYTPDQLTTEMNSENSILENYFTKRLT
jgi:hypothetical protein